MATTVPAIKGKLGTTEYFVITMKARELVGNLTIPKNIDGWDELSIEEKYQRDINLTRVKNLIAPYFTNDEDRFFGSLIVTVINNSDMSFESITDIAKSMPGLYKTSASGMGFLTLSGGEVMVPLDGQHRLKAIEYAISGKDEKGNDLPNIDPCTDLAQEDITVILVRHDPVKSRKIFNKVNRYAKPTSKAQNLITDDDDISAVIARDVADQIIGSRLVNFNSNTLSKKAVEFTTLATLYEMVDKILLDKGHKINKSVRPEKTKEKLYRQDVEKVLHLLVEKIEHFVAALADKTEIGDDRRREIRETSLLGKPIAQLALVRAFLRLELSTKEGGAKYTDDEICTNLNKINWDQKGEIWDKVLMNGSKVAAGKTAVSLAGDFIAYMAGENLSDDEITRLENRYINVFSEKERKNKKLPTRSF